MKKTLIINISNSIVHIEEDAYDVLTKYLLSIKNHFSGTADNLEIVTDIENRIAELLLEKLKLQQKQVINLVDVEDIILTMGTVNDFVNDELDLESPVQSSPKRLYRDIDNKVLGGVIAGLSHYLNLNVKWIRVFFLLSILLFGTGFFLYILMWIIVPPAKTASEQLAMRGEAPNLMGFVRNFEEKMNSFSQTNSSSIISQLADAVARLIRYIFQIIGTVAKFMFKIAGLFIILMGIGFLLTLLVSVSGLVGFLDGNVFAYFPFNIVNERYQDGIVFAFFLTLFIPVLALVLFSIRYVFNKPVINKTLTYGLLVVWLFGVAFSTYFAAMISSEFKEEAQVSVIKSLPKHDLYILELDKSMMFSKEDSLRYRLDSKDLMGGVVIRDDNNTPFSLPRNMNVRFESNTNSNALLDLNYQSKGTNFEAALNNARNIEYKYRVEGNVLHLSPSLILPNNATWRDQSVSVKLNLPVGAKVKINVGLLSYMRYNYWDCDNAEHSNYLMFTITENGLECMHTENDVVVSPNHP